MIVIDTNALARFYDGLKSKFYTQEKVREFFAFKNGDGDIPFSASSLDLHSADGSVSVTFDTETEELPSVKLTYNGVTLVLPLTADTIVATAAQLNTLAGDLQKKVSAVTVGSERVISGAAVPAVVSLATVANYSSSSMNETAVAQALSSTSASVNQVFAVSSGSSLAQSNWGLYVVTSLSVGGTVGTVSYVGKPSKHVVYYVNDENYGFCIFDGSAFVKKVTQVTNNIYDYGGDLDFEWATEDDINDIISGDYVPTDDPITGDPEDQTVNP